MSGTLRCSGVWGIIVNAESVGGELANRIRSFIELHVAPDESDEELGDWAKRFEKEITEKLHQRGIRPPRCKLAYTGSSGEPAGVILFGTPFDIPPWRLQHLNYEWRKVAELHTWIWEE